MTYALRFVLILFFLSLLGGLVSGVPIYYRLSYVWGILLVGSWWMSRISLRGIKMRRTSRTIRSQVGNVFEERYEITNSGRIPRLWIEVRDKSQLPYSRGSHVITMIGGGETHSYLARTRLTVRGVFSLGPTILAAGDLFGLFPVKRELPSEHTLLVYPMMVDVMSFPNPPGLLPGGESLRRRTPQITSNAAGVREYAPGDPLNRIHWVSTARRDRLIVKEFELDPLAEVWIFVDADHSNHVRETVLEAEADFQDVWRKKYIFQLPPDTIEYAVTCAASLARYYLEKRRTVGFVSAGSSFNLVPSDRGGRQLGKILEALALVQPDGKLPLFGLVELQARYLPRGSTIVLITPNFSDDVYQTVDLLIRRGLRPVAVLIDGSSFGSPYSPAELAISLQMSGIPNCVVEKGADLSGVLSHATGLTV